MSKRSGHQRRVVYSTDSGAPSVCTHCGALPCRCPGISETAAASQSPRVQREKGGRGGKTVTMVYELDLGPDQLKELAGQLKRICATGGSVKDGTIVIQGDHADRIVTELKKLGYRARRSGG